MFSFTDPVGDSRGRRQPAGARKQGPWSVTSMLPSVPDHRLRCPVRRGEGPIHLVEARFRPVRRGITHLGAIHTGQHSRGGESPHRQEYTPGCGCAKWLPAVPLPCVGRFRWADRSDGREVQDGALTPGCGNPGLQRSRLRHLASRPGPGRSAPGRHGSTEACRAWQPAGEPKPGTARGRYVDAPIVRSYGGCTDGDCHHVANATPTGSSPPARTASCTAPTTPT